MDAPLVLSTIIIPSEVDDQVHGLDIAKRYPLELYEAAKEMKISQPTLSRLLKSGRKKLAEAIVKGKAIKIKGGSFEVSSPK